MKNNIFITAIVLFINIQAFGQINLEHTYPNTGALQISFGIGGPFSYNAGTRLFYLVHLEFDGDKFVEIDRVAQTIIFYNLNHTLFTSINYSNVYTGIDDNGPDYAAHHPAGRAAPAGFKRNGYNQLAKPGRRIPAFRVVGGNAFCTILCISHLFPVVYYQV